MPSLQDSTSDCDCSLCSAPPAQGPGAAPPQPEAPPPHTQPEDPPPQPEAPPPQPEDPPPQPPADAPPAPLTLSEVNTEESDRGTGESFYLDRQNVDCGSDPINGFQMRTIDGSSLTYRLECAAGANLDQTEAKSTGLQDAGDGNLIFLDRLNVDCGMNAAVSQFRLGRDGDEIKYDYTCKAAPVADSMIECEDLSTPPNDGGGEGGNQVELLDRHHVACPASKVIVCACVCVCARARVCM
jgi:hypothetical protein